MPNTKEFYTKRCINERCFMTECERAVLEAIQHIQNCQGVDAYISDSFVRGTAVLSKDSVTRGKKGLKDLGVLVERKVSMRNGTRYQINHQRLYKLTNELNNIRVTSARLIEGNNIRMGCGLEPLNNSSLINSIRIRERQL